MKRGDTEYLSALDETMEILRRWAREGRTDGWYKSLSEELKAQGHHVHYRGPIISHLLGDACRRDSQGLEPMLSSMVILKATGRPAGQFFELAEGAPFHRTASDWSWETGALSRLRTLSRALIAAGGGRRPVAGRRADGLARITLMVNAVSSRPGNHSEA